MSPSLCDSIPKQHPACLPAMSRDERRGGSASSLKRAANCKTAGHPSVSHLQPFSSRVVCPDSARSSQLGNRCRCGAREGYSITATPIQYGGAAAKFRGQPGNTGRRIAGWSQDECGRRNSGVEETPTGLQTSQHRSLRHPWFRGVRG